MVSDIDWEDLLYNIEVSKCTPFVGAGAAAPFLPLASSIAKELAMLYHYPLKSQDQLSKVSQFLSLKRYAKTHAARVIADQFSNFRPPDFTNVGVYSFLADNNFPIFLTTNYDCYLEAALKARWKNPVSEFCRWNSIHKNLEIHSIFEKQENFLPTVEKPLVYHLHGMVDVPESMVLTDDDYLEFLSFMTHAGDNDILPPAIRISNGNDPDFISRLQPGGH